MRGDVIIVEEHHRRAAETIVAKLADEVRQRRRPTTFTVAGESGSGKSETGKALKEAFERHGVPAQVLQQDDYFVLPPKSNDRRRREDISWVGTQEVQLDLLDDHLRAAKQGEKRLTKPLVIYEEDKVTEEELSLEGVRVVIAEGTYTTLLEEADHRVFIDRDYHATLEARKRRAREPIEPFIEQVLEIEHGIIAPSKERADIIIGEDYEVSFL
ncbi:MAG: uridine kinase family protein [Alkalispirochaetaceae bacterium]